MDSTPDATPPSTGSVAAKPLGTRIWHAIMLGTSPSDAPWAKALFPLTKAAIVIGAVADTVSHGPSALLGLPALVVLLGAGRRMKHDAVVAAFKRAVRKGDGPALAKARSKARGDRELQELLDRVDRVGTLHQPSPAQRRPRP
jgi:hypothetical protein